MLKISISTPCQEDWNKMTPTQQGRHCDSCMKTVVDFTAMTDDQVKNFLLNHKEEHACGRFTSQQLQTIQIQLPPDIFVLQMPFWKRFLVACLFVFGTTLFSCEVKQAPPAVAAAAGEVINSVNPGSGINEENPFRGRVGMFGFKINETRKIDSADRSGEPKPFPLPLPDAMGAMVSTEIMGDTEYVQEDTTTVTVPEPVVGLIQFIPADTIPPAKMKKAELKFIPQQEDSADCKNFS
ncbi:hypothetical protein BH11BAC4_BH11BAC4_23000 [soil metagenome]